MTYSVFQNMTGASGKGENWVKVSGDYHDQALAEMKLASMREDAQRSGNQYGDYELTVLKND